MDSNWEGSGHKIIFIFVILLHIFQQVQGDFRVYIIQANITALEGKYTYKDGDWCSTNGTYCYIYGPECECGHDADYNYYCECPSALDYTLRLAAGIAIILLIGFTIMLGFTLYRRAMKRRRGRQSRESCSNSEIPVSSDLPPLYAEINIVSLPRFDDTKDFEKLPTYDEALEYMKNIVNSNSTALVLNTEIFLHESYDSEPKGNCSSSQILDPNFNAISSEEINTDIKLSTEEQQPTNELTVTN